MSKQLTEEGISLTLNPSENADSEMDFNNLPKMKSVVSAGPSREYSAGTIDESMLTEEERQTVAQFVSEIDITNVEQIVSYGASAQQNISSFSVSILKQVRTHDLGDIGDTLKELTVALDATTEPEKKGLVGLFQKAKRGVGSVMANYAKAETNVDKVEKDLRAHQKVLTQDVTMYQQMYELNTRYYKELTMYIIAGKKALDKAEHETLEELRLKAEETNAQEDAQMYEDFRQQCDRFDKKLITLENSRLVAVQSAPQIRLLQNNDREMLDKIQESLSNIIPLWRNQLVISLGVEHSRRAIEAQETLSNKTNELLAKNAETLKIASIDAARESERPIVDVETLKQCNKDLITSINEVVKIHEQGKVNREKAREELEKIEVELKQTLLETGKR